MRRAVLLFTVLCLWLAPVYAQKLDDEINHQYKNRTYTLRHSFIYDQQKYDAAGNLLNILRTGPWTIYARVRITKISIEPGSLMIEAERVGRQADGNKLKDVRLGVIVALQIALDHPVNSPDEIRPILGRVFAFTKEEFVASMPEYWRTYLELNLQNYSDDGQVLEFTGLKQTSIPKLPDKEKQDEKGVYAVTHSGVKAPAPVQTPDPPYNSVAKTERLNGVDLLSATIDETGKPVDVIVLRPLGLGLDDSAVETVKNWKFEPAKLHGEVVKVKLRVEVHFQLV